MAADTWNGPTPEQFETDLAEVMELQNVTMRHATRMSTVLARHESLGGDKRQLKRQARLRRMPKREAREEILLASRYDALAGLISWDAVGQGVMFADITGAVEDALEDARPETAPASPASQRMLNARAYSDGYNSAKAGGTLENNIYTPGADEHVNWSYGFHDYFEDAPHKRKPDADAKPKRKVRVRAMKPAEAATRGGKAPRQKKAAAKKKAAPKKKANGGTKAGWDGKRDFTDEAH